MIVVRERGRLKLRDYWSNNKWPSLLFEIDWKYKQYAFCCI